MAEITKIIGERIRIYRNRAHLSQEDLAEKAGLHTTYIGQVERGEKNATIESIEKIAKALDVPLELLFDKIISGNVKNDFAIQFYNLINALPQSEQIALYELTKKIIEYKKM